MPAVDQRLSAITVSAADNAIRPFDPSAYLVPSLPFILI